MSLFKNLRLGFALSVLSLVILTGVSGQSPKVQSPFDRWEKEIQAMESAHKKSPRPEGAVLFVGSSTIRLWKSLADDFPKHQVINHGFGGSQMADSVHFADRIVIPFKPKMIVIHAGGNDINAGKSPETVFADFKEFVAVVHKALPDTKIAFSAISPSPSRWKQAEQQKRANQLIRDYVKTGKNLDYIDIWDQYLGSDGLPREDCFVADRLHNNTLGYKIRADVVRPHLP